MIALREIVSRENFKNFEIPEEFGDEFEMILLPIENGELRMESEDTNYFEIKDKNGVLHKIPNWTEDEFREFGLKNFFKNDDIVSPEELFDV